MRRLPLICMAIKNRHPQASEWMMQTFDDPETIVTRASAGLTLAAQEE